MDTWVPAGRTSWVPQTSSHDVPQPSHAQPGSLHGRVTSEGSKSVPRLVPANKSPGPASPWRVLPSSKEPAALLSPLQNAGQEEALHNSASEPSSP